MGNNELEMLEKLVKEKRDDARPSLELVVDTVDQALMDMIELGMRRGHCGPTFWSWHEDGDGNISKVYTVSTSTDPDTFGYPLFTIKQPIAPTLDSYLVSSGLVLGPDRDGIRRSMTNAVVIHTGAFAGLRSTVDTINREGPTRGLLHALKIGNFTASKELQDSVGDYDADTSSIAFPPPGSKRELN